MDSSSVSATHYDPVPGSWGTPTRQQGQPLRRDHQILYSKIVQIKYKKSHCKIFLHQSFPETTYIIIHSVPISENKLKKCLLRSPGEKAAQLDHFRDLGTRQSLNRLFSSANTWSCLKLCGTKLLQPCVAPAIHQRFSLMEEANGT